MGWTGVDWTGLGWVGLILDSFGLLTLKPSLNVLRVQRCRNGASVHTALPPSLFLSPSCSPYAAYERQICRKLGQVRGSHELCMCVCQCCQTEIEPSSCGCRSFNEVRLYYSVLEMIRGTYRLNDIHHTIRQRNEQASERSKFTAFRCPCQHFTSRMGSQAKQKRTPTFHPCLIAPASASQARSVSSIREKEKQGEKQRLPYGSAPPPLRRCSFL